MIDGCLAEASSHPEHFTLGAVIAELKSPTDGSIVLRYAARTDLAVIYIAMKKKSPTVAIQYLDIIHAACQRLSDEPERGRRFNDEIRYIQVLNHTIYYSHDKNALRIERIIHGDPTKIHAEIKP